MSRLDVHRRDADRRIGDLDAARAEAHASAPHPSAETLRAGEGLDGPRFESADEPGRVLPILPPRDVVRWR